LFDSITCLFETGECAFEFAVVWGGEGRRRGGEGREGKEGAGLGKEEGGRRHGRQRGVEICTSSISLADRLEEFLLQTTLCRRDLFEE
jgi:hypothetical protein